MNKSERKRAPFVRKMVAAILAASLVAGVVFCFNIYNDKIAIPTQSEQTNAASLETDIALKPDSGVSTSLADTATSTGEVITTGRYFEMVADDGWDLSEQFYPANINVNSNNFVVAFGGLEWSVVGGKDADGKDILTGAAPVNGAGKSIAVEDAPNNSLILVQKERTSSRPKHKFFE